MNQHQIVWTVKEYKVNGRLIPNEVAGSWQEKSDLCKYTLQKETSTVLFIEYLNFNNVAVISVIRWMIGRGIIKIKL